MREKVDAPYRISSSNMAPEASSINTSNVTKKTFNINEALPRLLVQGLVEILARATINFLGAHGLSSFRQNIASPPGVGGAWTAKGFGGVREMIQIIQILARVLKRKHPTQKLI